MTYKQALRKSLNTIKTEKIEFDSITGEHVVQEPYETLSIAFPYFIKSMSMILFNVAQEMLREERPNCYINGIQVSKGKALKKPTIQDCLRIIGGDDFFLGSTLYLQLSQFLQWLLNQKAVTESELLWYDLEPLVEKWNEFAMEKSVNKE